MQTALFHFSPSHDSFMNMDEATSRLSYAESYSAVEVPHRSIRNVCHSVVAQGSLSRQRDFDKAFEDHFAILHALHGIPNCMAEGVGPVTGRVADARIFSARILFWLGFVGVLLQFSGSVSQRDGRQMNGFLI